MILTNKPLVRSLFVIALTLTFAFSAFAAGQGEGAQDSDEPVEVTLYQLQVAIVDQLAEIAEMYNEANPAVRVVTDRPGTDYFATLRTMFASGSGPDIFSLNPWTMVQDYQESGLIADLSDEPYVDRIVSGAKPGVTIDGRVHALPMEIAGIGIIYNQDIFEDLGLEPPATISELEEVVEILNANGITPFAVAYQDPWTLRHLFSMGHSSVVDDVLEFTTDMQAGNASFDTPALDGFFEVLDLMAVNNQDKPFDSDYTAQTTLIGEGEAAMLQQGLWALSSIRQIDPDFRAGIFALPVSDDPNDAKLMVDANSVYVVHNGEQEQESREFLRWLSAENTAATYAEMTGTIPALQGVSMDSASDAAALRIQEYANSGQTVPWGFSIWPTGFDDEVGALMQEYLADRMTKSELLGQMDSTWRQIGR